MRWCQPHWDALRDEVKGQGLNNLVPATGEAAASASAFARQLDEGEPTVDSFDPLMGAMWAVNLYIGNAMGQGGMLAVIALDGCPVCKVDEIHMPTCMDDRHPKPCTTSIDWVFAHAVGDQRAAWEAMRP